MNTISIKGLDKAAVLAALYNQARVQGLGALRASSNSMTIDEARTMLGIGDDHAQDFPDLTEDRGLYFDYLNGRVMKVDLRGDEFDPWGYDRDNGTNAAMNALRTAGLIPE